MAIFDYDNDDGNISARPSSPRSMFAAQTPRGQVNDAIVRLQALDRRDRRAHVCADTRLERGNRRVGTFTATTLPTATAVDTLIDDALTTVEAAVGQDIDGNFLISAKTCVIYNTAMLIELSYFPESTESGDPVRTRRMSKGMKTRSSI